MTYLLDTSAVSEWVKPRPDAGLIGWLSENDESDLFLSVMTLAELRDGVERLGPGRRRSRLEAWLDDDLQARFADRILPADIATGAAWGRIVAVRRKAGRPIASVDALIAATASQHDLTLVTRDIRDFAGLDLRVLSPWSG